MKMLLIIVIAAAVLSAPLAYAQDRDAEDTRPDKKEERRDNARAILLRVFPFIEELQNRDRTTAQAQEQGNTGTTTPPRPEEPVQEDQNPPSPVPSTTLPSTPAPPGSTAPPPSTELILSSMSSTPLGGVYDKSSTISLGATQLLLTLSLALGTLGFLLAERRLLERIVFALNIRPREVSA